MDQSPSRWAAKCTTWHLQLSFLTAGRSQNRCLAAQNLEGGRTAPRFKILIPVCENSVCAIKAESSLAKLIKESRLIIWDETAFSKALYTPLNKDIRAINDMCLALFPGEERAYFSADSVLEDNPKDALPVEFLISLTPSGLPDHEMKLKVGAPIMLLRNLQIGPDRTLKNSTRMVVAQMMDKGARLL